MTSALKDLQKAGLSMVGIQEEGGWGPGNSLCQGLEEREHDPLEELKIGQCS